MSEKKPNYLTGYFLKTAWQLCDPAEECGAVAFNIGKVLFSTANVVLGL